MLSFILRKLIGTKNQRVVKGLWGFVHRVNELEAAVKDLSDDELKAKTPYLKQRLANGEDI